MLLHAAWRDVDWRWLAWLALGNAICIPLGVALLALLPEQSLRFAVGGLLLGAALLLRTGCKLALEPTAAVRLGTGLLSGLANGLAGIGGIAVATLLSTSTLSPATLRATLVVLFLFTDLWALAAAALMSAHGAALQPLLVPGTLQWTLWLAPVMLAGIWLGQRLFRGVSQERFRQHVLNVLTLLAGLVVLRALRG